MLRQIVCSLVTLSLLALCSGFPSDGDKETDTRVGLDRPNTAAQPEVSDCGLDTLSGEVIGSSSNPDCGKESNKGSNNSTGGFYPSSNNKGGYNPPRTDTNSPNDLVPENAQSSSNSSSLEGCQCVQYYLCNDNNTINDEEVDVIDLIVKYDECNHYMQKCCTRQNIRSSDNPITPKPKSPKNKCGNRNSEGIGLNFTGSDNETKYGEFPWMVAVLRSNSSLSSNSKSIIYQCGGSLIHPQVVLTGVHCVRGLGINDIVIKAGEWDSQTIYELYPTQDRPVREVIIHEQFNKNTLANDLALLILDSPVDMSVENVGLICLPENNEIMDGRDCVTTGWGKDSYGKEGKYQVILKKVELPIVPSAHCLEALRKTRLGPNFELHQSFICAGGNSSMDTCKGDGGSPLVCPSRSDARMYVQAGIVAWGINCGTETPGVYVNVPGFVNWINNKLQAKGISLDAY